MKGEENSSGWSGEQVTSTDCLNLMVSNSDTKETIKESGLNFYTKCTNLPKRLTHCTRLEMRASARWAQTHLNGGCRHGTPAERGCSSSWTQPHQCGPQHLHYGASRCRHSPHCRETVRELHSRKTKTRYEAPGFQFLWRIWSMNATLALNKENQS